jgi:transcriptional antiterminator NusG
MIFTVRTVVGQERMVADMLYEKVKKSKPNVYSILVMDGVKGYLIVEALTEGDVRKVIYGLPHIKGVIKGQTTIDQIKHLLELKPLTEGISKGDIVELTSGPFKSEKAKIIRVDALKDEITLELTEAVVPIPVTVKADMVRVIIKETPVKEKKSSEESEAKD